MKRLVAAATLGVLAVAIMLWPVDKAPAQCYGGCYTPSYYPTYYPPVQVVEKIIEKVAFVAVPTLVPTYSTGFLPPAVAPAVPAPTAAAPQAQAQPAARDDRIMALLEKMDRRLTALENAVGAPPPEPPPPPPAAPAAAQRQASGMGVLQSCAACHTEGKPFSKNGRATTFVMFKPDGKLALAGAAAREKVRRELRLGKMPLDPNSLNPVPLNNDQYADVLDVLDAVKPE